MTTERVNRAICDRCTTESELSELSAYYGNSPLPGYWIRVQAPIGEDKLYFDLCPACKLAFGDYVSKWLKHWGKP